MLPEHIAGGGNVLALPFDKSFNNGGRYVITLPVGVVESLEGIPNVYHVSSFFAVDELRPQLIGWTPSGEHISRNTKLQMFFNEAVTWGPGRFELVVPFFYETEIVFDKNDVTWADDKSSFEIDLLLDYETPVEVRAEDGAFVDTSGLHSHATSWVFTTTSPSGVVVNDPEPLQSLCSSLDPRSCFDKDWWGTCEESRWACASPSPVSCTQQSWVICGRFTFASMSPLSAMESMLASNQFDTAMRFTVARFFSQNADSVVIEQGVLPNTDKPLEAIAPLTDSLGLEGKFYVDFSIQSPPEEIVHRYKAMRELSHDWRNFDSLTDKFRMAMVYFGSEVPLGFSVLTINSFGDSDIELQNFSPPGDDTAFYITISIIIAFIGVVFGIG